MFKKFENIFYYIRYVMIKDLKYIKIINVDPLYLTIGKRNGCFKENNRNKYLTLVPTKESK